MNESVYKEEYLPDLLPLYYRRLFPLSAFYTWLCYGDPAKFDNREISFTLFGDIYLRYQSFNNMESFVTALCEKAPIKIDVGAIYKDSVKVMSLLLSARKKPIEREVVFDIDLTDYDEIRTCCSEANVCIKCWKFMVIACKILDAGIREDFNYKNILWVFSGRRGIHCWVADKDARRLDDIQRTALAEFFSLMRGGSQQIRPVRNLPNIHTAVARALKIIDEYFVNCIVIEQDILGNDHRLNQFLSYIEPELKLNFSDAMLPLQSSELRWNAFLDTFQQLQREHKIPRSAKYLVEEIKLSYAYPRIDINVSKNMNHLLKAPFCVHPKTGKVSIPFSPKLVDNFDPDLVPTISQLMDEINEYEKKTKLQEEGLKKDNTEDKTEEVVVNVVKIKDYKKTSLLKPVNVFNEFLRGLKKSATEAKVEVASVQE